MDFTCQRCKKLSHNAAKRNLICTSCNEDLDLLATQSEVNQRRIHKLEQHKKSTEYDLKNLDSKKNPKFLLETMARIEHNLKIEYDIRTGILEAIKNPSDI